MGWVTSESRSGLPVTLWQQAAPAVECSVPAVSPGLPATSGMAQMVKSHTVEVDTVDANNSPTLATQDGKSEIKLKVKEPGHSTCGTKHQPPDTMKLPGAQPASSGYVTCISNLGVCVSLHQ